MEGKKNYIKIGVRCRYKGYTSYEAGTSPNFNGWDGKHSLCFKDEEIYLNEPDEYCFISEAAFINYFEDGMPVFKMAVLEDNIKDTWHKSFGWTHNDILEGCREFFKIFPEYSHLDTETLAYEVFRKAIDYIHKYSGKDLWIGNSFLDAAKALVKNT